MNIYQEALLRVSGFLGHEIWRGSRFLVGYFKWATSMPPSSVFLVLL
jgi:hypothetical protein